MYAGSKLDYLDCSYNKQLKLDILLPHCTQLYITNNELHHLNLELFPKLNTLDCGCNKLDQLDNHDTLEEINMQENNMTSIPHWPKMKCILAADNKISIVKTFHYLRILDMPRN